MPSSVGNMFTQNVNGFWPGAEINAGAVPFVAINLENTADQIAYVYSIIANAIHFPADEANINRFEIFIQRGLKIDATGNNANNIRNVNECLFIDRANLTTKATRMNLILNSPVILPPANIYAIVFFGLYSGVIANFLEADFSVLGMQAPSRGEVFPLTLR